uniref:Craniofacial development protein 2-like n=1 Tax=Nicotiana sylvestris TaxID=4096 RepID=A0A1U7WXM1_NICSY|nr:PREDICTED: craniofacial development protein 2-like [Nicotiana sylvestris]
MSSGGARGGSGDREGVRGGLEGKGSKGNKGVYRLRIRSWNVGTLTGKSIELAKILQKRRINIPCVQETSWAGSNARDADGYKLWELRQSVVEVRRVNDRLMIIKLVVGQCTLNVISAYAPHAGLDEEVKRRFWEGLDEIVRQVPPAEKLFIGGDFNCHIGSKVGGYDEVHRGFGFGERNGGGTSLLDFAKAFGLNAVAKIQIDYLLIRRCDRGLYKDFKVIPGEILVTRHRLFVMDVGIVVKRRKMSARGRPRIRWGALTKDKAQEL